MPDENEDILIHLPSLRALGKMRFFAFVLLASRLDLVFSAVTAPAGLDPIRNFCSRIDHQSTVKNNILFIDGGTELFSFNATYGAPGTVVQGYNTYLIAINMSTSWDWKTNITETLINKTANLKTGTSPPLVVRGALYQGPPGDPNVYLYGGTTSFANTSFPGFQPTSSDQYTLWSYDTTGATSGWKQYDISISALQRPSSGAFAEALDLGLAFYYNGEIDSGSSLQTQSLGSGTQEFLEGMVVIDLNSQTARNVSTTSITNNQPRTRGRMQYMPNIGSKGILLYMGGAYKDTSQLDSSSVETLVDMSSIDVFDVSSLYDQSNGTAWYTQHATGDVPSPRIDFCLVMAAAPDNSSYNIYAYGGRNTTDFFDEVYVLSVPSFTWTKIYAGESPRFGMTCHLVGNRQMVTVGGQSGLNNDCDWEIMSVAVYDLTDLEWGSVFDAKAAPYTVPSVVSATIGGNASGHANLTTPPAGYVNAGLARLFNSTFISNVTSTSSGSSSSSNPPSTSSSSTNHTSTGAIVGGVLGGLIAIGLIAAAIYLFRKRQRRPVLHELNTDEKAIYESRDDAVEKDASTLSPDVDGELSAGTWPPIAELPSSPVYAELSVNEKRTAGDRKIAEMGGSELTEMGDSEPNGKMDAQPTHWV